MTLVQQLREVDAERSDLFLESVRKLSKAGLPQPIGKGENGRPEPENQNDKFLVWGDTTVVNLNTLEDYNNA